MSRLLHRVSFIHLRRHFVPFPRVLSEIDSGDCIASRFARRKRTSHRHFSAFVRTFDTLQSSSIHCIKFIHFHLNSFPFTFVHFSSHATLHSDERAVCSFSHFYTFSWLHTERTDLSKAINLFVKQAVIPFISEIEIVPFKHPEFQKNIHNSR